MTTLTTLKTRAGILIGLGLLVLGAGCPRRPGAPIPQRPVDVVPGLPSIATSDEPRRFIPTDAYYHFMMGRIAAEGGNCERAIVHFDRAATSDPESSYLHQVSAECLLRLGRVQAGLTAAERAVDIDDHNIDAKLLLSRAYLITRDTAAAERLLEEVLAAAPGQREATELLAEIALGRGDEQRAVELVTAIAAQATDDARPTFYLGRLFLRRGSVERAIELFEQTIERDPAHERAHELLIAAYERQRRFEDAARIATSFAELHLGELDPLLEQVRLLARAEREGELAQLLTELSKELDEDQRVEIAGALARGGDSARALILLGEITKRRPQHDGAHVAAGVILSREGKLHAALKRLDRVPQGARRYSDACAAAADVLLRLGRHRAAVTRLERAIEASPERVEPRLQLADLAARLGEHARALEVLDAIPETQRDTPRSLSARSRALHEAGRVDQSVALIQRAMASRPEDPELLLVLALAFERAEDHAAAEGAARQLLTSFPDSVTAQNFLAYTYALRAERLDEALELAQRAAAAAADDGYVADTLGYVLHRLGRHQEAQRVLQRANSLSPDEPEILLHLGDAEAALGHHAAARRHYQRALKLLPREPEVRRALSVRLGQSEDAP